MPDSSRVERCRPAVQSFSGRHLRPGLSARAHKRDGALLGLRPLLDHEYTVRLKESVFVERRFAEARGAHNHAALPTAAKTKSMNGIVHESGEPPHGSCSYRSHFGVRPLVPLDEPILWAIAFPQRTLRYPRLMKFAFPGTAQTGYLAAECLGVSRNPKPVGLDADT